SRRAWRASTVTHGRGACAERDRKTWKPLSASLSPPPHASHGPPPRSEGGSACGVQRSAGLPGRERLFGAFILVRTRLGLHPGLLPSALQIIADRKRQVDERTHRET